MGMYNPIVRWWVIFSLMFIAMFTTLIAGFGKFIIDIDQTYLSWVILAIFLLSSWHLGWKVNAKGSRANFGVTDKAVEICTSLGLLGTIIGLILMITGAFIRIDVANHESLKVALMSISSGIGTALITTLVGIVCAIGLQIQLAVVREDWGV